MQPLPNVCNETLPRSALPVALGSAGSKFSAAPASVQDGRFDCITRLASRTFDVPIVGLYLSDGTQRWFESGVGLDVADLEARFEQCVDSLFGAAPLVVADTRMDARLAESELVRAEPPVWFYAGAPVRHGPSQLHGMLFIMDHWPRKLAPIEISILCDLAGLVDRELLAKGYTRTDPLTRVATGDAFLTLGQSALSVCQQAGVPAMLCLFTLQNQDTDNIEHANADDPGHREFAALLRGSFRGSDIIARLDTGEFAVLATHCGPHELQSVLRRLGHSVSMYNRDASQDATLLYAHAAREIQPGETERLSLLIAQSSFASRRTDPV